MTTTTFDCAAQKGDGLELVPHTDGDVTVTVYDTDLISSCVIARSDIPKLITLLQIILEQGNN